jgi:hypothetical protein
MTTNTAGTTAREYHTAQVHYLSKEFTKADAGLVLTLGVRPGGSYVVRGGVVVTEAFNAGTNNRLDVGTSADDDGFATDLALGTVGVIVADEMATTNDAYSATDQTISATVDVTGSAATTGAGFVWVEYIVPMG